MRKESREPVLRGTVKKLLEASAPRRGRSFAPGCRILVETNLHIPQYFYTTLLPTYLLRHKFFTIMSATEGYILERLNRKHRRVVLGLIDDRADVEDDRTKKYGRSRAHLTLPVHSGSKYIFACERVTTCCGHIVDRLMLHISLMSSEEVANYVDYIAETAISLMSFVFPH